MAGASVRTRPLVARLMILAVFAMMFGQVVAMPSASLASNASVASNASLASNEGSFAQPWSLTQISPEQDASGMPCHHDGSAQGLRCCFAGDCVMLTLVLPVAPLAALPAHFRLLVYRAAAMPSLDGAGAAPLLPPPRYPV